MPEPNIHGLFPTPVMFTQLGRAFTKKELNINLTKSLKDFIFMIYQYVLKILWME